MARSVKLEILCDQQIGRCFHCKAFMVEPTVEHVIPLSSKEHPRFVVEKFENQVALNR